MFTDYIDLQIQLAEVAVTSISQLFHALTDRSQIYYSHFTLLCNGPCLKHFYPSNG
jgi:hypothetical protein